MKEKLTLLATAIGSLPNNNPNEALDLIFSNLQEFPVWPQLSKVNQNEDMIIQYTQNIPGAVYDETEDRWYLDTEKETFYEELEELYLDYESIVTEGNFELLEKYAISGDFSSTIQPFLSRIKQTQPTAIKGQITGPFSWGTSLIDREKKCAFYDETLREVIIKGLTLKALWQVYKFKQVCPNSVPVIFLDEPSMSQYGTSAFITVTKNDIVDSLTQIADVLKASGAMVGVHCCGKTDWSLITQSTADIINFDSFYFGESLSLYSKEVELFIKNGGMIAWGITPTLDEDALKSASTEILLEKFELAKSYLLNKGIDENLLIKSSFITPTCGCGSLNVELATKALNLTSELAKKLRETYLKG